MEKTFSIEENGMDLFGILPIPQNFWPKDPKDIFTAYVYKSIALMNKLKEIKC